MHMRMPNPFLEEIVGGPPRDMWLSAPWCRIKLKAETRERVVRNNNKIK